MRGADGAIPGVAGAAAAAGTHAWAVTAVGRGAWRWCDIVAGGTNHLAINNI